MSRGSLRVLLIAVLAAAEAWGAVGPVESHGSEPIHHQLTITLRPEAHELVVEDLVRLSSDAPAAGASLSFLLHGSLIVESPTPGVVVSVVDEHPSLDPIRPTGRYVPHDPRVPVRRYGLRVPAGVRTVTLRYRGVIYHPPLPRGDEYARSMDDAPGMIGAEGIFLGAPSYWYPAFDEDLLTFTLTARAPAGWTIVSQGARRDVQTDGDTISVTWDTPTPQDEMYVVGGQWTEYRREDNGLTSLVWLRKDAPSVAKPYLDATPAYVLMYADLLGAYPYPKFALIENVWETGYGMPSFTLLGSTVLRLPFILRSSYPHEILHNWWGNGVYVDYRGGNWCEGLTAYLADHLMAEQRGGGAVYRRNALKRYTDYVDAARDFPLAGFRERHSPSTQAVGYGKTMMLFHMLRVELGDSRFVESLRTLYREQVFHRTAFSTVEQIFSRIAGRDLSETFAQWITRTGAPQLRVGESHVERDGDGYRVHATIEQVQDGPAYRLRVPVAVHFAGAAAAHQSMVIMEERTARLDLRVPSRPVRLDVDPEFDVMRRLARAEIPPTLSQPFGTPKAIIILPAAEEPDLAEEYRRLARSWQQTDFSTIDVVSDRDVMALPSDRAVWVLGWRNRFRDRVAAAVRPYDVDLDAAGLTLGGTAVTAESSVVVTARQPDHPDAAIAFLATAKPKAIAGLGRKVPHYDRYSYLVFEGDEPKNVAKGEWPVVGSPLSVLLPSGDDRTVQVTSKLADRPPLARSPVQ